MSIKVEGISKFFGAQKAVSEVSFEIGRGEIVGFLGPNGAGKSTSMKILTGSLPADEGEAWVNEFNTRTELQKIKASIGYLPEHNPLYLDMYVKEFLIFCGKLYDMKGKKLRQRVAEVVQLCGLEKEQHKQIAALSKGYRQRVGLAQALIHDPDVLILDEPTTGLDPNQIIEIRNLIQSVSQNKTVLLSTHIMQEVQALCCRAIIIKNGNIVADKPIDQLTSEQETVTIRIEIEGTVSESIFSDLNEVQNVKKASETEYLLECTRDIRKEIMKKSVAEEVMIVGVSLEKGSMEEVFHRLTRD